MNRIARIVVISIIFSGLAYGVPRAEQACKQSVLSTSPAADFNLGQNGTAVDNKTGLMWMRCSLGQEWIEKECRGEADLMNWGKSLQVSTGFEFAGYTDWRLPNKNELVSIVEERCSSPSINSKIFPSAPPLFFWTSSPYAGLGHGAWSVDFGFGTVSATVKTGRLNVRLVRDLD